MDLSPRLVDSIKRFEGYSATPYWDYKQYTSGYGTRASGPNEQIDQATANSRLQDALTSAASQVDSRFPNLSSGTRDALISLTYNAGPAWMSAGLGNAVQSGNMDQARDLFAQYNKAGGEVNPGLTARRQAELSWFDQPGASLAGGSPAAPAPGMPGLLGGTTPDASGASTGGLAGILGALGGQQAKGPNYAGLIQTGLAEMNPQMKAPNLPNLIPPPMPRRPIDLSQLRAMLATPSPLTGWSI
jgi:GH24 family phage-related lysozyme (muramidase)